MGAKTILTRQTARCKIGIFEILEDPSSLSDRRPGIRLDPDLSSGSAMWQLLLDYTPRAIWFAGTYSTTNSFFGTPQPFLI